MAINTVNSAGIADGSIVNADIKSDAAIAGSKLADESITLAKLEHGDGTSNGKYLKSNNGGDPTWETVSQYSTPITTQGDILFRDGSGDARLAKGTNGQFLKIGASEPTWADVPAGSPTGGNSGANKVFWENEKTINYNYTISDNHNAGTFGPVTIAATGNGDGSAVTVTIGDGETWTII